MAVKKADPKPVLPSRPIPPKMNSGDIIAAPDVEAWIRKNYISHNGALFSEDHAHLENAVIGCLWAAVPNQKQMRRIIGQAEMPQPRGNAWTKARAEHHLISLFGVIPDFILTFDAKYVSEASDIEFCALVDHELTHCAQAKDDFGAPRFTQDGLPKYAIRGHDVEEFISVVRRFGVGAAGQSALDFVSAAKEDPVFGSVDISKACGTCCG